MLDNRKILEKADLAVSQLTSDGGVLQPESSKEFIRIAIKKPKILQDALVKPMGSDTYVLPNLAFSGQVLHPGSAGVALDLADRSAPVLGKSTLTAKLFKAEADLDDETIEDNIEEGRFQETIMTLLAEAAGRDMEKVVVQGDTTSSDLLLKQLDGMIKLSATNTSSAGDVRLSKTVLKAGVKAMPDEFLEDLSALRIYTQTDAETDYRDSLADRGTVAGDKFTLENAPALYRGIPVVGVSLFPISSNQCSAIITDPKNVAVGIRRNIKLETQRDARSGKIYIVASIRWDFTYVYEPATVKITAIKTN